MIKTVPVPQQPDAQERLMVAALDQFTRFGYAATSTREICAAAGVTKPVLYYYFKSKEGLYRALIEEAFVHFEAILLECSRLEGNVSECLIELCDRVFLSFMEKLNAVRLMYSIYYGPHQGAPFFDFEVYHLKLRELVRNLVKKGISSGEMRAESEEDEAWVVIGILNIAFEEQLCRREALIGRADLTRLVKLALRGFDARIPSTGVAK